MFIELQQPPPPAHRGLGIAVQTWYPPRSKLGTVADQATMQCWRKLAIDTKACTANSSQRAAPQDGGAKRWLPK